MPKLDVTWDGIHDSTGYLFSFTKSLACAVKHSPWADYAEDIRPDVRHSAHQCPPF